MNIKELVLERLGRETEPISGEAIAAELGVSRAAVWKAISQLRDDGYSIEAAQKRGYLLQKSPEFSAAALADELSLRQNDELSAGFERIRPFVLDEVSSTNIICREIAADPKNERREALVVADHQSAGRGRLGRSFFSPNGGLYMSLLLYPNLSVTDAQVITTVAAVSVCKAIEKLDDSFKPSIKWVNDVYLRGKKICGILTEGQVDFETGQLAFAVLGIGVNIWQPIGGWSPEIADRAGSLYESLYDSKNDDLRLRLAALITAEFYRLYLKLRISDIIDYYRERMFLTNMEVTVIPTGGEPYSAVVLGVDDQLRLAVKVGNDVRYLSSGEVSLKI